MSFDDYAEYITQKLRLSTAIAIIKTKPENLTTEQYINGLKNKMNNDKMGDDFDDICSDDFNIDDDAMASDDNELMNISETILKDYNFENDLFVVNDVCNDTSMVERPQLSNPHISENLTQTTYYETQPINPISMTQADDNQIIDQAVDNDATYCDTIDIDNNIPRNIIKSSTNIDSQKTILYSVYGLTQNTHYSPSQTNIIIPNRHIYGNNNIRKDVETNNNISDNKMDVTNDNFPFTDISNTNENDDINDIEVISTIHDSINGQIVKISNGIHNGKDNANYNDVTKDNERRLTKETSESNDDLDVYSKTPSKRNMNNDINNLEYVTHENQNMYQKVAVNDNYRISNPITEENSQYYEISCENMNESKTVNSKAISQIVNNASQNFADASINTKYSMNTDNTDKVNITKDILNQDSNINLNDSHLNIVTASISKTTVPTIESSQNTYVFSQNDEIFNENNDGNDEVNNAMTSRTLRRELNKALYESKQTVRLEEDSQEVIPFKILEEFNKVKGFLSRSEGRMSLDGYSSDSGYRSDSQGRCNKGALQLSGNWLNQSGHSLFNYIMSCHLVVSTRDITNEIAQVLGQLIDKLHEEEKYPSFLEPLLEANNLLLQQLCEGDNNIENVLLNRDENVQRLILLNRSVHIQKFCIEKINNILNDYHTKLTDTESIFELSNIDGIENLYYIFHLLEYLLKKYNKNKDLLSQTSTQPSQDEGTFKKSTITDLWKRKWNPNYQDGGAEDVCEKTCVQQVCCEILNKIIVDSLNSYSLVSYAALKCFNLTQS